MNGKQWCEWFHKTLWPLLSDLQEERWSKKTDEVCARIRTLKGQNEMLRESQPKDRNPTMNESTCSHSPCKEAQMYVNGNLLSGLGIHEGDYACLSHKIKGPHAMCGYKNSEDCRIHSESTSSVGHEYHREGLCVFNWSNRDGVSSYPHVFKGGACIRCGTPLGEKCTETCDLCKGTGWYYNGQDIDGDQVICTCPKGRTELAKRAEQPEKAEVLSEEEIVHFEEAFKTWDIPNRFTATIRKAEAERDEAQAAARHFKQATIDVEAQFPPGDFDWERGERAYTIAKLALECAPESLDEQKELETDQTYECDACETEYLVEDGAFCQHCFLHSTIAQRNKELWAENERLKEAIYQPRWVWLMSGERPIRRKIMDADQGVCFLCWREQSAIHGWKDKEGQGFHRDNCPALTPKPNFFDPNPGCNCIARGHGTGNPDNCPVHQTEAGKEE